jgi:hypothetical protein
MRRYNMLKTNSKAAREHIRQYILNNTDFSDYSNFKICVGIDTENFKEVAKALREIFISESRYKDDRLTEKGRFIDWCQGLPSSLDTCYYYNRSAVDDLGRILEENETEKGKYSETEAAKMLSTLIYRELSDVWRKDK